MSKLANAAARTYGTASLLALATRRVVGQPSVFERYMMAGLRMMDDRTTTDSQAVPSFYRAALLRHVQRRLDMWLPYILSKQYFNVGGPDELNLLREVIKNHYLVLGTVSSLRGEDAVLWDPEDALGRQDHILRVWEARNTAAGKIKYDWLLREYACIVFDILFDVEGMPSTLMEGIVWTPGRAQQYSSATDQKLRLQIVEFFREEDAPASPTAKRARSC